MLSSRSDGDSRQCRPDQRVDGGRLRQRGHAVDQGLQFLCHQRNLGREAFGIAMLAIDGQLREPAQVIVNLANERIRTGIAL